MGSSYILWRALTSYMDQQPMSGRIVVFDNLLTSIPDLATRRWPRCTLQAVLTVWSERLDCAADLISSTISTCYSPSVATCDICAALITMRRFPLPHNFARGIINIRLSFHTFHLSPSLYRHRMWYGPSMLCLLVCVHSILLVSSHSSLSRCSNRVRTTCLLVSSISPARNTSSRIAYTCEACSACHCFPNVSIAYLVEIENQIQLANVSKELI